MYTITDIATLGWVSNLVTFFEARGLVAFDSVGNVVAWLDRGTARHAVKRRMQIPRRAP